MVEEKTIDNLTHTNISCYIYLSSDPIYEYLNSS